MMVVSDQPAVRRAIAAMLTPHGHEVAEATTGAGALRRLERVDRPASMIVALNGRGTIDGRGLVAATQRLFPAVSLLAVGPSPRAPSWLGNGAYLPMPFSADALLARVAGDDAPAGPVPVGVQPPAPKLLAPADNREWGG
jgi:CheY-like chemotaxis protein